MTKYAKLNLLFFFSFTIPAAMQAIKHRQRKAIKHRQRKKNRRKKKLEEEEENSCAQELLPSSKCSFHTVGLFL